MIYLNEIDPLDSNIRNWKFHGEIGSGYIATGKPSDHPTTAPEWNEACVDDHCYEMPATHTLAA